MALVVSGYHLPRLYMTTLKAMRDTGIRIPIIPRPVPVSPDRPNPERGANAWEMLPGEVERIIRYIDRGFLAGPDELRDYLSWLWSHHQTLLLGSM